MWIEWQSSCRREVNRSGRSTTAEFKCITNFTLKLNLEVSVNSLRNTKGFKAPKLAKKPREFLKMASKPRRQ